MRWGGPEAEHRLAMMYERYGVPSLFLSRFLPGIRALVPVFAGAARLPFIRLIVPISLASGLWYGFLAFISYRAAADWETLQATISQYNRGVTVVAVLTVAGVLGVWLWRRKRRATWTPDVTRHEELNRVRQRLIEEEGRTDEPSRDAEAR